MHTGPTGIVARPGRSEMYISTQGSTGRGHDWLSLQLPTRNSNRTGKSRLAGVSRMHLPARAGRAAGGWAKRHRGRLAPVPRPL